MGAGLQTGLQRAGRGMIDLLFPPLCVLCRAPVGQADALCVACWNSLQFIDGPVCACCGLPFEIDAGPETLCGDCLADPPDFDAARAILRYDDASKKPVLALKHADRLDLVPAFAKWLNRTGHALFASTDLVVPVPLHRMRLWKRRYNQSAELARALCRLSGKPYTPLVLERRKATPSQGTMPSAAARRQNVAGAFAVPQNQRAVVKGRTVLLVDDVLTTGATVGAAARALKRAGATSVFALALARVVRA